MRYVDRSRTELDWTCPRARFWQYEWEGIGLVSLNTDADLAFGLAMAEQTAQIKLGKPWTIEGFVGEQQAVAKALLLGYELLIWPRWLRDYDLVRVEEEQPLRLAPWLTYSARPDTIVKRKSDGTYWYGPEDKTTAWVDSLLTYANAIQLHATAIAIEANHPFQIMGCLVQGLYKGFVKEGKFYHALVWAYCKEGRAGIVPDQWSIKWVRGWERTPVEQFEGGTRAWILSRKPEDLAEVFPNSEPVMIKRTLAQQYLDQVLVREQQIERWREEGSKTDDAALREIFPQHFSQCDQFGKSRKPCVYKELCYNQTAKRFPLTFYKKRVPHHEEERRAHGILPALPIHP